MENRTKTKFVELQRIVEQPDAYKICKCCGRVNLIVNRSCVSCMLSDFDESMQTVKDAFYNFLSFYVKFYNETTEDAKCEKIAV